MLSASKSGSGAVSGYNLTRSLRFRSSASAYLSRTPASSGNRTTWTYSVWAKLGAAVGTSNYNILMARTSASYYTSIYFNANNLYLDWQNSSQIALIRSSQVFRDPSAWYHIVVVIDSTNATSSNRIKMYVNGTQVTAFTTANYPPQNAQTAGINEAGIATWISSDPAYPAQGYYDGYLAEVNFIDGQALTPSSFGSTNALTGVWQPARYTGSYGTNGFYLPFTDNSALTTSSNVGLGKDFSGNGNYWTTNNISITAGVTYDSMTDVPTLTSATAANYAVLNPVALGIDATLTNGNLNIAYGTATTRTGTAASIGMTSGKYYWEITITASSTNPCDAEIGISNTTENSAVTTGIGYYPGYTAKGWGYYGNTGEKVTNAVATAYGSTYTTNDVIGVAFDATAGSLTFYKNNTSQGVAFSSLPAGTYYPAVGDGSSAGTLTMVANFGQRPFSYTPPTGFVALNTYNLPDSTIVKGNTVMDATLYTGNGSTQTITNAAGFKSDFIWLKSRSAAGNSSLTDSVRGVNSQLFSNLTNAEGTQTDQVTAFNSNGFSLGANAAGTGSTNVNTVTYVGWQWQAGQGSTSSNTNGTITSTVSVNASAGFSVVTYTGVGSTATVGHGLGVAPSFYIIKQRSAVNDWYVFSNVTGSWQFALLNSTQAFAATSQSANSSTLSLSGTSTNASGGTFVAYCWTPIAGFSAFGSYTGNGSSDGPMIYTGFRPKFVMVKCSSSDLSGGAHWAIEDSSRSTYNAADAILYANLSNAEGSGEPVDFLSNGFKIRNTVARWNSSGATFIYMAFAESPFRNSLAR